MAVRCKECSFVAKEDEGFCPECGAMYVDPEIVDESEALKPQKTSVAPKKKSGGLFSSLFGGGKKDTSHTETPSSYSDEPQVSEMPDDVDRSEIKVRCKECKEITGVDDHDGYCPGCGAYFVEPMDYVTNDSLAAERAAQAEELEKYKNVKKDFSEMNDVEKLEYLDEKVEDQFDQLIRDRHVLNEKANECMQCFTAAGTIKSNDQFEVMASMVEQRFANLEDFEMLKTEYLRLLNEFKVSHDKLVEARQEFLEQQNKVKGGAPAQS